MKAAAPAALLLLLTALIAGCGGGGSTTVIEKTVTVEAEGSDGPTGGEAGAGGTDGGGDDAGTQEGGEEAAGDDGAAAGDDGATESSGPAEETIEEPTRVVHLQSFRSPSGNIGCVLAEGGVRCDIRERQWSPPARPSSCPEQVDYGQGLSIAHAGKPEFVCAGDTTLDPSAAALPYGEVSELGGTQCFSRSGGMTCANHAGHGFFISVQSYRLF
jgi:hypothetical protein